jgi:hypothetical protein
LFGAGLPGNGVKRQAVVAVASSLVPVNQPFHNSLAFHAVSGQPRAEQATKGTVFPAFLMGFIMLLCY